MWVCPGDWASDLRYLSIYFVGLGDGSSSSHRPLYGVFDLREIPYLLRYLLKEMLVEEEWVVLQTFCELKSGDIRVVSCMGIKAVKLSLLCPTNMPKNVPRISGFFPFKAYWSPVHHGLENSCNNWSVHNSQCLFLSYDDCERLDVLAHAIFLMSSFCQINNWISYYSSGWPMFPQNLGS